MEFSHSHRHPAAQPFPDGLLTTAAPKHISKSLCAFSKQTHKLAASKEWHAVAFILFASAGRSIDVFRDQLDTIMAVLFIAI
eukprot:scaffold411917_cov34-Prasinocladus_malaysianus.AAC.1